MAVSGRNGPEGSPEQAIAPLPPTFLDGVEQTWVQTGPPVVKRRFRLRQTILAASVVVLVGVLLGVAVWAVGWWRGSIQPVGVVLNITPWANIESIQRQSDGRAVPTGCQTVPPRCRMSLAPATYVVRARNPNYGVTFEFTMKVVAGTAQEITYPVPGIRPEDEVDSILKRQP